MIEKTHLILLANVDTLDEGKVYSSSGAYELMLASAAAQKVARVSIVSHRAVDMRKRSNITLYPTGKKQSAVSTYFDEAIARYGLLDETERTVILFWGYHPATIRKLGRFQKKAKVVAFVYDTHLGTIAEKSWAKQVFWKGLYAAGLHLINRVDGVLLFRQEAAEAMKLRVPYLVTLPFADLEQLRPWQQKQTRGLTFSYAGTLCPYNATQQLVAAFSALPYEDVTLNIFGDGICEGAVREAAARDGRIHYYGRVTHEALNNHLEQTDVLLNLRDMDSVVNRYAFPSKLVEYMRQGRPVISTRVHPSEEFERGVFLLRDVRKETITELMETVYAHPQWLGEKAEAAAAYLKKYHDSQMLIGQMTRFLFETLWR